MNIVISPRKTLATLLIIIGLLVCASSVGVAWFIASAPVQQIPVWINVFNLNLEGNVPTLFSSLQLMVAALLLSGIAHCHRQRAQACVLWYFLAAIFIFLAIDEAASLHENLTVSVRTTLETSGYFYYAWVIPYGLAVLLLAALFTKFLLGLPRTSMALFMVSGAIYLTGTLGFEMLGGNYTSQPGAGEITYSVIYTVEETLEMVGIAIFIFALMKYIANTFTQLNYSVQD